MRFKAVLLSLLMGLGAAGGALGFSADLEGEVQRDLLASRAAVQAASGA